jgi:hypothetical protein
MSGMITAIDQIENGIAKIAKSLVAYAEIIGIAA